MYLHLFYAIFLSIGLNLNILGMEQDDSSDVPKINHISIKEKATDSDHSSSSENEEYRWNEIEDQVLSEFKHKVKKNDSQKKENLKEEDLQPNLSKDSDLIDEEEEDDTQDNGENRWNEIENEVLNESKNGVFKTSKI